MVLFCNFFGNGSEPPRALQSRRGVPFYSAAWVRSQKPLSLCFSCIQVVDELKINELELEVCSHFEKRVVTGLHDSMPESFVDSFHVWWVARGVINVYIERFQFNEYEHQGSIDYRILRLCKRSGLEMWLLYQSFQPWIWSLDENDCAVTFVLEPANKKTSGDIQVYLIFRKRRPFGGWNLAATGIQPGFV